MAPPHEPPPIDSTGWWKQASTGRKVLIVLLGLFIIGAVLGGSEPTSSRRTSVGSGAEPVSSPPAPQVCEKSVTYRVEGTARAVSLTYENAQGNTEQIGSRPNGATINLGPMSCGDFVYVSAQNQGETGTVVCRILVDGAEVESATSTGAYVIATCSGAVPR